MGMSASQARFLGLTARKNNVEFEGQQVNQQRTSLSNESANYYNDLLGMTVPTPPSVDNYTKTVYTFEDGSLSNTITALIPNAGDTYSASYLQESVNDFAIVSSSSSIITRSGTAGNYSYNIGATQLRKLGETETTAGTTINDEYLNSLTEEELDELEDEEAQYLALLQNEFGTNTQWMVRYIKDSATGKYTPNFYNLEKLTNSSYEANGNSQSSINCYSIGSKNETNEVKNQKGVKMEFDSTGRAINISIPDYDEGGNIILDADGNVKNYTTYALTTSTVTDQDAYDDAMNQYEYEKYQYDQSINNINSKIEIIQSEDKNLELRLKQLDTEQDAISQEITAVSKVIEKNVESSFKTFG